MDGTDPTAVDERAVSERASAAFSALGNETRLEVLLALWETTGHPREPSTMTFSEFPQRVGTRGSVQFNYQLDQLVGEFVRKTDAGYALTATGDKVV